MVKARSGNPFGLAILAFLTLHSNAFATLTDSAIIEDSAVTEIILVNFIISSVRLHH